MEDASLFHRLTAQWGGRCPREQAPEDVRDAYDEVAERADDLIGAARRVLPDLLPIYFDFIWNSRINAVAFLSNGRYFIGINTGTLFMLRMLIGRFLSDARFFPAIGDPKSETQALEPLADYFPDAEEMIRNSAILTPCDDIRRSYAWFLQDQAVMFLVGHEIAHITRGHVAYLAEKGHGVTTELGVSANRSEREILERQCLEFDADRCSIDSRIDSVRITFQNPAKPPMPWAPSAKGPGRMIQDWAVSLNIVFRLFGDKRLNRTELTESSHPPMVLRRMACEAIAVNLVSKTWDARYRSTTIKSLLAAEREVGAAFATMLGPELAQATVPEQDVLAVRDHATRLQEFWDSEMAQELSAFAYE